MGTVFRRCGCGHFANFHAHRAQIDERFKATGYRFGLECNGGQNGPHCRCTASFEDVMEHGFHL